MSSLEHRLSERVKGLAIPDRFINGHPLLRELAACGNVIAAWDVMPNDGWKQYVAPIKASEDFTDEQLDEALNAAADLLLPILWRDVEHGRGGLDLEGLAVMDALRAGLDSRFVRLHVYRFRNFVVLPIRDQAGEFALVWFGKLTCSNETAPVAP